ncbi:ABC transporter substrate-binding protein [Haloferax sp. MBLA0076]|uniref:ABC transporter substrate-binding protein n=1 Tax=Haloferax litoreum TaxID=2666140 RepID=A0A6A8GEF6_9EURY|nr:MULTISPECIES: ABC transporter substrate-binding protein [Haloferax]KAB1192986.1 ABC transporter substrate-binding protein [Haloferax sp. CBA1148]MRX21475.1 ABC transporter substrate-binding protein [Haloferax litoreum]
MDEDGNSSRNSTRRSILKGTGVLVAGGLLAGCTGQSGPDQTETATTTDAETVTETATSTATETTEANDSYSVSIEPVGDVEFDAVPETWVANNGSWADMGVALGLEPPKGVWLTSRYHTQYYDAIPGLSVDKSDMVSLYQDGVSKELFYELDADVHVMDPNFLMNRFKGWEQADVDEVDQNVGPMFGNCIYAQHYPWHEDYRYYTLYEGFEKLAQVFQRTDRYEAFVSLHDEFQTNLESVVPAEGERPSAAVLWGVGDEPESFYPYIIGGGTGFKHLRDLGVNDALADTDVKDFHGSRAAIDLETLLEVDPEVLMLRGYEAKTRDEFENTVVSSLQNHDTASALTAVQNDDVYRAGGLYQGPITNFTLTQRTAEELYGVESQLYDAEHVADIVNGDI